MRPPLGILPEQEKERFHRVYCGLCHTLGERYGQAARFILNFDFTYLAILLSEEEESETAESRCWSSPLRKRPYATSTAALELAADESVILAYWQLRDGVEDHDWLHGLKYRSLSSVLEPAYRKAAAVRPAFDQCTREHLRALAELERQSCDSMDRAADAFAGLLAGAAEEVPDPVRRRVLHQLLYHLGRWVYLIDAADDLKKDAETGNYNPVALRFHLEEGSWTPEARQEFVLSLDHSIHMMTTAYELIPFGVWTPILESTLYTGLFQVGRAVLDGTFKRAVRGLQKESKKVEEPT